MGCRRRELKLEAKRKICRERMLQTSGRTGSFPLQPVGLFPSGRVGQDASLSSPERDDRPPCRQCDLRN